MYKIALKMLIEDKAKFIGMIMSLSFSALIMTQQASTFIGLMRRTYGLITDTPQADIWVMDKNVKFIDDVLPLRDIDLFRIRSVEGVTWAVPYYKGIIEARLSNGQFQTCILIGIDDSSLIGSPHTMVEGTVEALRLTDAVIVNKVGAEDKLARKQGDGMPKVPMHVGDILELNDRRAVVVGICDVSRTFQSQPVVYTTYKRALIFSPFERRRLSFVLVKADGSVPVEQVVTNIKKATGLAAYSKSGFEDLTVDYYLKNTGIPINFGIVVLLGLLVGAAIAGLIFYNFITDNLRYLALFAAMGASQNLLIKMCVLQALWVALIGWGVGSGCSALMGFLLRKSEFSFYFSWIVFLGTGVMILSICMVALLLSIRRIFNMQLWTMFR